MRTRVKICGVTRPEDAERAAAAGADSIGLNFFPKSKRFIRPEVAKSIVRQIPPMVEIFGVFADETPEQILAIAEEVGLAAVQLHGSVPTAVPASLGPRRIVRAFNWRAGETPSAIENYLAECAGLDVRPVGVLLDAALHGLPGGTGITWDWEEAVEIDFPLPVVIAGGLNPDNVGRAIAMLRPYGVDVAGGVEGEPGIKDSGRMQAFIAAVRAADANLDNGNPI